MGGRTEGGLMAMLNFGFSEWAMQYNVLHKLTEQIALQNRQTDDKGLIRTAASNMVYGRYEGITSMGSLLPRVKQGACWAWYFGVTPLGDLQKDVAKAGSKWVWANLWESPLDTARKALATAVTTDSKELHKLHGAVDKRVNQQMQEIGISLVTTVTISQVLKHVGNKTQSAYLRQAAFGMRKMWQVTGLLALANSVAKIHDVMDDTDRFGDHLRVHRDACVQRDAEAFCGLVNPILVSLETARQNEFYHETGQMGRSPSEPS